VSDIRLVLAHPGEQVRPAAPGPGYVAEFDAAVTAGALCVCGGVIGGYRTDAPHRENGEPRGVCRCFRARARQVPAGARR